VRSSSYAILSWSAISATHVVQQGLFDTDHQRNRQDRPFAGVLVRFSSAERVLQARSPRGRFLLGLACGCQAISWARLFAPWPSPWPCFAFRIPAAGRGQANHAAAPHTALHLDRTRLPPSCFRLLDSSSTHTFACLLCAACLLLHLPLSNCTFSHTRSPGDPACFPLDIQSLQPGRVYLILQLFDPLHSHAHDHSQPYISSP
jgi:hypothetical protein